MFSVQHCDSYTLVAFDIPGGIIAPSNLCTLRPPDVDGRKGVVLSGRGPVWLYAFLCHFYHPTRWIGCFDPRLGGAVVVQTHCPNVSLGQVITITDINCSTPSP